MATNYLPNLTVDRPFLRAKLDQALRHRLTVVIASAGAGKSVLLTQWVQSRPDVAFVWLTVERADNDAAHLAKRLVGALTTVHAGLPDMSAYMALGAGGLGSPFIHD